MAEESISANVLGEHGDSQFVNWSAATVAGQPLDQLLRPDFDKAKCAEYVRRKAYKIIEAKGATYFGIAAVTASICQAIFLNSRIVRPLSHFQGGDLGCCISLPAIIGRSGIVSTLHPPLTLGEQDQLKASAEAMRAVISKFA